MFIKCPARDACLYIGEATPPDLPEYEYDVMTFQPITKVAGPNTCFSKGCACLDNLKSVYLFT